jgi:hypothetical protein
MAWLAWVLQLTLYMPTKRIVFEHRQGPHVGLVQIMGLVSELGVKEGDTLPSTAEGFEALDRLVEFASLVQVKRSFALYREIQVDSEGKHLPQRLR